MGTTSTCQQVRTPSASTTPTTTTFPLVAEEGPSSCREPISIPLFSRPHLFSPAPRPHSCLPFSNVPSLTLPTNKHLSPSYNIPPASTPHLPLHGSCPFSLLQSSISEKVKISPLPHLLPNSFQFGSSPSRATEFSPRSPKPFHLRHLLLSLSVTWLCKLTSPLVLKTLSFLGFHGTTHSWSTPSLPLFTLLFLPSLLSSAQRVRQS